MVIKQNFPHVVLEEQDVPDVLRLYKTFPAKASVSLKRWLATGGLTLTGGKLIWSKDEFFS